MKVIDLLNKIANGEEVPKKVRYNDEIYDTETRNNFSLMIYETTGDFRDDDEVQLFLNDEINIIEDKKMPEKLPYYSMEKIQKAKDKDEWREERILLLEKKVEDLHTKMNDLLDYLQSKGE